MFSVALKAFNLIRQGCLYVSTFISATRLVGGFVKKVELDCQAIRYNKDLTVVDPVQDIDRNNHQVMRNFAQLIAFGYSSYRVITGEETPFSLAVSYGATALMLYHPVKGTVQAVMENETVAATTKKIFQHA